MNRQMPKAFRNFRGTAISGERIVVGKIRRAVRIFHDRSDTASKPYLGAAFTARLITVSIEDDTSGATAPLASSAR